METDLTLGRRTGHSSELPRLLQSSAASGEVGTPAACPEAMFPEPSGGSSQGASHALRIWKVLLSRFTLEISRLLPVAWHQSIVVLGVLRSI